jgi:hypothetical protein
MADSRAGVLTRANKASARHRQPSIEFLRTPADVEELQSVGSRLGPSTGTRHTAMMGVRDPTQTRSV